MNKKNKLIILGLLIISTVLYSFAESTELFYQKYIVDTIVVNSSCYLTSYGKTGVTANGTKIKKLKGVPGIIAISPDLKKKYPLGTKVAIFINDSCKLNGIYTVSDYMNNRFKKKIDILVEANYKKLSQAKDIHCWKQVKMMKLSDEFENIEEEYKKSIL